jgi:uncharacterized DUF497 family protein
MDFEWSPKKAQTNAKKHGVTFEDASTVFGDPSAITFFDPDHSIDGDRFINIGRSDSGKLLIVAHTDRGERTRIINARLTTRRESKFYEKEN